MAMALAVFDKIIFRRNSPTAIVEVGSLLRIVKQPVEMG